MKFNKWTLGLAAVGVVSLASVAKADEKLSAIESALSATTISGYVDTSFEWTLKPDKESTGIMALIPFRGNGFGGVFGGSNFKQDGFNLNVVKLSFEKPLDEGEWASGYRVDLLAGPDAVGYNSSINGDSTSDFGIKQAYVALRTPIGNGIDWKVGVFDTIIGYESFEAGNNPNFTRSFGWSVEPTQHTGILGTYKFGEMVSVTAGIANTLSAGINNRNTGSPQNQDFWEKAFMGSIAITLPESAGAMKGSTLYAGIVQGFNGTFGNDDQLNLYLGATLATPINNLKVGAAFDFVDNFNGLDGQDLWILGLYASFQMTEKLSIHGRGEWIQSEIPGSDITAYSVTGTIQYDLWANVISRLELRWDEANIDNGGIPGEQHLGFYANVIYKF